MKVAKVPFVSNINQLPYQGSIGTYDYDLDTEVDSTTSRNVYTLTWEALPTTYSPAYVKFRVKSQAREAYSDWCTPQLLYFSVRYDVYKRVIGAVATSWQKIETVAVPTAGPYQESYSGNVEYAVCISHRDSALGSQEGFGANPFVNPYLLFSTGSLAT